MMHLFPLPRLAADSSVRFSRVWIIIIHHHICFCYVLLLGCPSLLYADSFTVAFAVVRTSRVAGGTRGKKKKKEQKKKGSFFIHHSVERRRRENIIGLASRTRRKQSSISFFSCNESNRKVTDGTSTDFILRIKSIAVRPNIDSFDRCRTLQDSTGSGE